MIKEHKVIVVDVDGTLGTHKASGQTYGEIGVSLEVKQRLVDLKSQGYWIILATSRSMRTYEGNIGQIIKNTAPVLLDWLAKHDIPYDEIHFGKPWCGHEGFYVDDRAIRPREFVSLNNEEIAELLQRDRLVP
jgi:capsule biosynthesis phosphatase